MDGKRTITELWQEYQEYRQRYQDYYAGVHGDQLDFGGWLMALAAYEYEMPVLTAQLDEINPCVLQDGEGGWYLLRDHQERSLWQRIADLENALAL